MSQARQHTSSRPVRVSTLLEPTERPGMDAAGTGVFNAQHRDSVEELSRDLRERRITAVVVSVSRGMRENPGRLAGLVREFPRVPTVALLSGARGVSAEAVLSLGNCGVRRIVDVRDPAGWHQLRTLVGRESSRASDRAVLSLFRSDLEGIEQGCWRFFEGLFATEYAIATVRQLAAYLGVIPSTLMSRFFRARLPAPKQYITFARLIRTARLLENPGISVADAANQLDFSSPQSFGRHVRTYLGITAGDFRRDYTEARMIARFRNELVLPHREALVRLRPVRASGSRAEPELPTTGD